MKLSNFLEKATKTAGIAALAAIPVLTGCAKKEIYRPPSLQFPIPRSPQDIIRPTARAAQGALICLQTPPAITVDTATAAKSCLIGGDLPAEANCGGYKMQAICHQPTYNSGILCTGVKSVTCNDVTVIGQNGPVALNTGRIPATITVPAPGASPNGPASPWAIPGLPGMPSQGLPGLGQNLPQIPGFPASPFPINN